MLPSLLKSFFMFQDDFVPQFRRAITLGSLLPATMSSFARMASASAVWIMAAGEEDQAPAF